MTNPVRAVLLILVTAAWPASPVHGQNAGQRPPEAADGSALALNLDEAVDADDSRFAAWAFGRDPRLPRAPQRVWTVETARSRLDSLLERKIKALDYAYELTDAQRQKLELAGRGDLRRLFERIEEVRKEFQSVRNDEKALQQLQQKMQPIKSRLTAGLFDDGSLFAKTLAGLLTDGQKDKYDQRVSRAGTQTISIRNCVAMLPLQALPKEVYQIVWNRDGAKAAFVSLTFDRAVEILQLPEFRQVATVGGDKRPVGFDFSPTENIVAITDNSQMAFIVNIGTGQEICLQTANPQPSVRFSPDGTSLMTGGYGTAAKLWETSSGKLVRGFETGGVEGGLTPVFSPDGRIVAVGNRNSTTCLFDVASGRLLHRLDKVASQGLRFDPTGKTLAVAYVDATLGLWEVESGNLIRSVRADADELYSVDWSPDGTLLVTAGNQGQVTFWDPKDLSLLAELESPEWVITARFTPDGKRLVFSGGGRLAGSARHVEIWGVP